MKQNLQKSNEALNTLIDNHPDPMVISDINGIILAINKKLADVFGKKKNEIIGTSGFLHIGKSVVEPRKKMIDEAIKTKKPVIFEDEDFGKWWSTKVKPILDKDGNVVELVTYIKDITKKKETEEKFQLLSDQSLMGITIIQDDKFKYFNKAFVEMSEYSKEELIAEGIKILTKIIHPDYLEFVFKQLNKKLTSEKIIETRYFCKVRTKKGKNKWVEIFSKTINYEGKKADFVTFVEITDRKKAEDALKESEQKFRDLADQSPNIIFINKKGRIVYVNKKCEEIMGYTNEELLTKDFNFFKLVASESHILVKNSYKKHLGGKDIPPYEYILLTKMGKKLNAIITTKLIEFEDEPAILGIITDITELKKAELEIKKGKDYLQNMIDSASEVIFTIDKDLRVSSWNKTGENLTGFKKSRIINKKIDKIKLFSNSSDIIEHIKRCISGDVCQIPNIVITTKDNDKKLLQISSSSIRNKNNDTEGLLFICKNITEDIDVHGRLTHGNGYIIVEDSMNSILTLFKDLVYEDNSGLFISRHIPDKIKNFSSSLEIKTILLSESKVKRYDTCFNPDDLVSMVKNFTNENSNAVVLIDRLDYIMMNFSFEEIMKTIYRINNIISINKSILLVHINTNIFDDCQVAFLREELMDIPSRRIEDIGINDDLYDILIYIFRENKMNAIVSFNKISNRFSISKVTTGKRLNTLEDIGLISIKKSGRSKNLHITKKGEVLLHKRELI